MGLQSLVDLKEEVEETMQAQRMVNCQLHAVQNLVTVYEIYVQFFANIKNRIIFLCHLGSECSVEPQNKIIKLIKAKQNKAKYLPNFIYSHHQLLSST